MFLFPINIEIRYISIFLLFLLLLGCGVDQAADEKLKQNQTATQATLKVTDRVVDKKILQRGRVLYLKNCSLCHGDKAQGTSEWRVPGPDGNYLPPPLNGTAHAWHHPTDVLLEVIEDGTEPEGKMPSWEGKLTDNEIRAIISWLQTLWSDQVFKNWQEIDLRSRED